MTRRVLLINYFFPPSLAVGAIRPAKFYRYLPQFGWEPYVLTIRPAADGSPLGDLQIIRTNYLSPWKWLERRRARLAGTGSARPDWSLRQVSTRSAWRQKAYFLLRHVLPMSSVRLPDATLGWYPFAVRAGMAVLKKQSFDLIWSSAGPPTNHLVAARLQRYSGLPWVADFRDLWSLNYQEARLPFFEAGERWLDRYILASAIRITTVSAGFARILADFYGREVDVVYNGYDDGDESIRINCDSTSKSRFILRYMGSLYPEMDDVHPFLQALLLARCRDPDFSPQIEFFGPELSWFDQLVQTYQLSGLVQCRPPVPHTQAIALQQQATALLLFDRSREGRPGVLPTKMFEYMQAERPILEIGSPEDESAAMIAQCRAGMTAAESEEICHILLAWWHEFQRTGTLNWSTDKEQVAQYSRRTQTGRLAKILNTVCDTRDESRFS